MSELEKPQLTAIIDADGLLYIACHNKKDAPIKTLQDCENHVDSLMHDIFIKTNATHYLAFLTVGKCFRYQVDPEYKANRKGLEKPPFFNQAKDRLILKWSAQFLREFEADDLVMMAHRLLPDSIVVTADKDLKCCIEGKFYDPKKDEFVTNTKEQAEYNFWKSMITGDTGDNIKGIPGQGPKAAEKLLAQGDVNNYSELVFGAYNRHFGGLKGVDEFVKNYRLLKIVEYSNEITELFPIPVPAIELPELPNIELNLENDTQLDIFELK